MKIKWRVSDKPTGKYRSFQKRGWPVAEFSDGTTAATLQCSDEYIPSKVITGDHSPLTIRVFSRIDHLEEGRVSYALCKKAISLAEAKTRVRDFYQRRGPDFMRGI